MEVVIINHGRLVVTDQLVQGRQTCLGQLSWLIQRRPC
jgi:hypothetical protein